MEDVSVLISGIDYKLKKLTGHHRQILKLNNELTNKVKEQEQIINHQTQINHELQEKLRTVSIAQTLVSRFEINDAKKKIGDLVREIDKCINLLSK
jgi:hypothetical protein